MRYVRLEQFIDQYSIQDGYISERALRLDELTLHKQRDVMAAVWYVKWRFGFNIEEIAEYLGLDSSLVAECLSRKFPTQDEESGWQEYLLGVGKDGTWGRN